MTGNGPKPDRNRNDLTNKTGKENGILAKMCAFSQKNEKLKKFLPKNGITSADTQQWIRHKQSSGVNQMPKFYFYSGPTFVEII